jgi:hypothetical protein
MDVLRHPRDSSYPLPPVQGSETWQESGNSHAILVMPDHNHNSKYGSGANT